MEREDGRTATDPAQVSRYVSPSFYAQAREDARALAEPGNLVGEPERGEAEALLIREAWLLDEGHFDEWLELFAPECLYWIPATPGGGDPAIEVCIAFDDRRRLEDRVFWLRSAYVWSQIPRSRTRRMLSNLEVLGSSESDVLRVRSNFVLFDVRPGVRYVHAGWYGHILHRADDGWRIMTKQVHLAESDQSHENLSILF